MSQLGFGLMRLPVVNGQFDKVDHDTLDALVDRFLASGCTYFDTAWFYHDGQSEAAVRECLAKRHPRDSFLLADKMPLALVEDETDLERFFEKQLCRCGVDYFDYYLLHDMGADRMKVAQRVHAFEFLQRKKEQGLVRNIGFSFHDKPEVLDAMLVAHPEVDFVQLQLNYLDWNNPVIRARENYETARRHDKPVIVMEPVKGGTLAAVPQQARDLLRKLDPTTSCASWALRFAAGLEGVMMVLSGMNTREQLDDNIRTLNAVSPLDEMELRTLEDVTTIINARVSIPCTGCAYCLESCPISIPITQYFALLNAHGLEDPDKPWTAQQIIYGHLADKTPSASACIGCGRCEKMCPQHLPIRKLLTDVVKAFE